MKKPFDPKKKENGRIKNRRFIQILIDIVVYLTDDEQTSRFRWHVLETVNLVNNAALF